MKILIIGGDKRTLEIIRILKHDNYIDIIGFKNLDLDTIDINNLNIHEYDAIIFPLNGIQDDYTVNCPFNDLNINVKNINFHLSENCIIFSGTESNKLDELFGKNYKKLMSCEDVAAENSIPTAEGIISNIIENTDETINNANITVLGYGKVGKTLTQKLLALGANVNIGVIEEADYISLIYKNIKVFYTFDMQNALSKSKIIINTVPKLLLDKTNLDYVKNDAYIIDISSAPFGVDFEYAENKNLKYSILKGIPGKVAPKTAGAILAKKIKKILKEGL